MGASGQIEVDFGAFPGASDASVAVTGQAAILGTSLVEAWLFPADTTDHSADEHLVETLKVIAGPPSAGVGFTIHVYNTNQIGEPLSEPSPSRFRTLATTIYGYTAPSVGGHMPLIYGKWNVGWVWV